MKKANLLILILLTLMLMNSGCSNYSVKDQEPVYVKDAYDLISVVESTHPAFVLDDIPDNYEQEKQEFIDSITRDTSKDGFILLIRKYLTVLQDGHTGVSSSSSNTQLLDVNCQAVGEKLFLVNEDESLSNAYITYIGGVPIDQIFKTVQAYFVAENDAARDVNNSIWSLNDKVLNMTGCDIQNNSAEITVDQNGVNNKKNIKFVDGSKNKYASLYNYSYEIKSEMINDIFYIDMNICEVNNNLESQVSELKKAIENGVTKVIIDVRDNPGGDSTACEKLLQAMDMNPPSYGMFVRYSELAHEKYGFASEGFEQYDPDKTTAKRNEKIQLVVLTNELTYSSATMMTGFVQDGDLGTVIGRPSSNSPSSYGDILYYQLPVSGIEVSISYKRFLRPDTEADPRVIMPDIVTEYGQDILQTAIEYLDK